MRTAACGFAEFLSSELSAGFCLDKAQLSGRPVQAQDSPGLQEVLVGGFSAPTFPARFSLLGGFHRMQSSAESGLFFFLRCR